MEYTQETAAWRDYQNGLAWQRSMGFEEKFPLYVRFKEGDQWPPATRRTRNLPRPVFNMVEMFIRTKRAVILDSPVTMHCRPAAGAVSAQLAVAGAQDFTDYARQLYGRAVQPFVQYLACRCLRQRRSGRFLRQRPQDQSAQQLLHHCWYPPFVSSSPVRSAKGSCGARF